MNAVLIYFAAEAWNNEYFLTKLLQFNQTPLTIVWDLQ